MADQASSLANTSGGLPQQGACDDRTHHLDKAELLDLVKNKTCPGSWKGGRVSYGLLRSLFEVLKETVRKEADKTNLSGKASEF